MKKVLIIARSPVCTIDDELKMGSKTTVILREYAIIRSAVSTPTISCRSESDIKLNFTNNFLIIYQFNST